MITSGHALLLLGHGVDGRSKFFFYELPNGVFESGVLFKDVFALCTHFLKSGDQIFDDLLKLPPVSDAQDIHPQLFREKQFLEGVRHSTLSFLEYAPRVARLPALEGL